MNDHLGIQSSTGSFPVNIHARAVLLNNTVRVNLVALAVTLLRVGESTALVQSGL